ncbi:MAG: hypothetical protein ACK6CU_16775 [Deltaproteobacteria bacterium]
MRPELRDVQFPIQTVTLDDMPSVEHKYKSFLLAISTVPGDFLPSNPDCARTVGAASQTIQMIDSTATTVGTACPVTANTRYYINVRPEWESCGFPLLREPGEETTSVLCRVAVNEQLPVDPWTP